MTTGMVRRGSVAGYIWLALLAACGDNDPDAAGDAGGPEDGAQSSVPITIETGAPPALIAFRDERSTQWHTVAIAAQGTFEIQVTGPYRVVVTCRSSRRFVDITEYARTLADEPRIEHPCGLPREFPFRVRGEMAQEGEVFFGGAGRGESTAPWSFELPAAAGTFDLLVWFGSLTTGFDRIAIRRDLTIAGDLALGTIDVATEPSVALVPTRFTPSNSAPDEALSATLFVHSGNSDVTTSSFSDGASWLIPVIPDDALRPTDTQFMELAAQLTTTSDLDQQHRRTINRQPTAPTSVQLMEPLSGIGLATTTNRLEVTWPTLPVFDELDAWRWSFPPDFSHSIFHHLLLTRSFVTETRLTRATLDLSDVPNFDPAWAHDPAFTHVVGLDAIHDTGADTFERSGVSQQLPAPASLAPTAHVRRQTQHLRAEAQHADDARARARALARRR